MPACSVRDPQALVSCDLTDTHPTVLVFFVTAGSRCAQELDAVERVRRTTPGVRYAAVAIKGDRARAAALARQRGWRFPVGYDYDGVLANLYGVAVCPHITYILPGGRVDGTTGSDNGVTLTVRPCDGSTVIRTAAGLLHLNNRRLEVTATTRRGTKR